MREKIVKKLSQSGCTNIISQKKINLDILDIFFVQPLRQLCCSLFSLIKNNRESDESIN